jgi:hypothetical protein
LRQVTEAFIDPDEVIDTKKVDSIDCVLCFSLKNKVQNDDIPHKTTAHCYHSFQDFPAALKKKSSRTEQNLATLITKLFNI